MFENSVLRDEALNPIWQEEGGRLLVEINSVPLQGVHSKELSFKGVWNEWVEEATVRGLASSSCYRWGGPDLTWNPGAGVLAYRLHIETPGDYHLCLRNFHHQESGGSCFVRFDGGQWAITRGGDAGTWSWTTNRETSLDTSQRFWQRLERGFHQIEISGRLNGFTVERLALVIDAGDLQSATLAASKIRPR